MPCALNAPTVRTGRSSAVRLILLLTASFALAAPLGGCRIWSDHQAPPHALESFGPAVRDEHGHRWVVLGVLEDPDTSTIPMAKIGEGVTRALADTMLNHGGFDVTINSELGARANSIVKLPAEQRRSELATLRQTYPQLRFVVTGKVTDFTRSRDKPRESQEIRLGWKIPRAIVALRLDVYDLELGRKVTHDHLMGKVYDYSDRDSDEVYGQLSIDEYVFWTTSLGDAAWEASRVAVKVLDRLVPTTEGAITIVRLMSRRRVHVAGGSESTFRRGDTFYVHALDPETRRLQPLVDRTTRRPLMVTITEGNRVNSVGLINGEPMPGIALEGAILSRQRLTAATPAAAPVPSGAPSIWE